MEHRTFLAARIDRWSREHPRQLDLALAGLLWLVFGLLSALAGLTAFLIATAAILPLAVRRRHPTWVLVWSASVFAVQLALLPDPLPANIAQAVVIYTVAAHVASFRVRLVALGAALVGTVLAAFRWALPPDNMANVRSIAVFVGVISVLVWVIGNLVRGRQANIRALREVNARLEESRVQRERFAAQQQRVSVAREIHDVVAHSLTVVIVQADGAGYAADHAQPWDRTDAAKVLATIGRTARSALTEVRSVIDVLRDAGGPDEPQGARVGVAELGQVIDSVRAAGLPVDVDAAPAAFDKIPAVAGSAVLRVVRESLTNVLKHAGPKATARVVVEQRAGAVSVRIEDDGVGARGGAAAGQASRPGYGVDGMRERLRALGGVLEAGPRQGGGFCVDAAIPYEFPSASAGPVELAAPSGAPGRRETR
ncbi:sensor histidine kinase [Streptomyces bathyalis]|uniref:histidine kinase n=1 Tax=Streptomyces bathyalis TaxID=2710756 RepID=A0A7T1T9E0_9ACTN|nr:histidine kinase [Streptomyces bathyalis]QPP08759.1 sensor histidine kinase [Streptomyces bathyalis]